MVKTRYFCDRCGVEVTNVGASFALRSLRLERDNANALNIEVCSDCVKDILAIVQGKVERYVPGAAARVS